MVRSRAKGEWRKPGRRQGYRVLAPERHLIVCEGEKTEPLYFQGMRDALKPEFRNRIHIVRAQAFILLICLTTRSERAGCRVAMIMFGWLTTGTISTFASSTP